MRMSKLGKAVFGWVPDIIMLAGAGSIAYGAWLVFEPAGFMVGGALGIGIGYLIARGAR